MKVMTSTEAEQNLHSLLDEVAQGEVVVIRHHGQRIVLRSEPASEIPDYSQLLRVSDVDHADRWGWELTADGLKLRSDD